MRYVCSAAAAVVALMISIPSAGLGQALADYSITNYQFVSEQRSTRTIWYVTYRADLVNHGTSSMAVAATVTSLASTVEVVPGQGTLHFPAAPPNGQVTSLDTFTILVDRSATFDFASLKWSFLNPVANAGSNQTVTVGTVVHLSGSGSSNPSGAGTLTYSWAFKSRPASSTAVLSGATQVAASFTVDVPGTYVVSLTVGNSVATDSTTVTISTVNSPPVAKAGPDQTLVKVGDTVTVDGTGSSDVDGDTLTYLWTLIAQPAGSSASLSNIRSPKATFVADKFGTYKVQLVVNDGTVNSAPATVTITTNNTPPVANAGPNQKVYLNTLVQLNGSASTDVDGNPLTYKWSFNAIPTGSAASLSDPTAVNPTFTADKPGTYVVQLIVNDGLVNSTSPSTVTITTNDVQAPVANAGPNQTVHHGALVTLNGSGTDPQGLPLTFTWSLSTRPPGSTATLSGNGTASPTFIADQPGLYVAQLIVGNGYLNSLPSTVTITTGNTPPTAVPGANQSVAVGVTVTLDGSASFDPDQDPLTYSWSLTSIPASSTTVLQGAVTKTPSFFADMPGTYVAQLIVNDGFTNSAPVTVTITASLMKITLSPNPLNLTNAAKLLTVTLGAPAGAGGVQVNFSGFDPNVISLPSGVLVPATTTGANVQVTPVGSGTTNIVASATGFQAGTTSVTVTTPAITLALNSQGVGLKHTIGGTITLSSAATANTVIALSASPAGSVTFNPANVQIPAGSTTGTFQVTGAVLSNGNATTITATSSGYTAGNASILVVILGGISLPTNLTVAPGASAVLDVKLSTPAPSDGATVTLTSGDTNTLTVSPSTLVFLAGATTPQTAAQVKGVQYGSATVTASADGFTGDSQTVKVSGTITFSTQAVTVGAAGDQVVHLLLSAPAPAGGLPITLVSSNTAYATVPASVTVAANSTTSPDFNVHGVAVGSATITASSTLSTLASGTLGVTVVQYGSIGLPSNATVVQGQSAAFPITLSTPAPVGGATVTLSTSDSTIVDISPKSVTILANQTQPASQPQLTGNALGQVNITASAPGWISATQPVKGITTLSFSTPTPINAGQTQNLTLTLASPAPAAGVTVNLSSSATGVATVPSSVSFTAAGTTVSVPVTGVAAGNATITATPVSQYVSGTTVAVTVQSAGTIGLPANVTVAPGQSVDFPVTLSAAPSTAVTVTLQSADTTKVTVSPLSVTIPAGQTQPAPQPKVTGVDFGSASITASTPQFGSASQSVKVAASLSLPNYSITGPASQDVVITLSAPAPSVVSISLSANPTGIVTLPATATIDKGATSVTVSVKGASLGATTITASSTTTNVSSGTGTITVTSPGPIGLPTNATVELSHSVAFPVTLPAPAPQGGVTVTLSSSDASKVSIAPSTVTIDFGKTQPTTQPQVTGVAPGTANLTASSPAYTSTTVPVQTTLTVSFAPTSLTFTGTTTPQTLTLTLSGAAPTGGIPFNVTSSNTATATVSPATVTVLQGATTATVTVTPVAAGSTVIHASAPSLPSVAEATANVSVSTVDITVPATATVAPNDSTILSIAVAKAPTSTLFLDISSSDTTKATVSPSSVTIAAGQTSPTQIVRVYGVSTGTVTITVKATNATLAPATTTVTVGYSLAITPSNLVITGNGNNGTLTLTLSAPAPAPNGLDIALTSSNPAVATVIGSANISASSSSIGVRVTSVAVGTTTITARATGIPDATATVTVAPPGSLVMSGPATLGVSTSGQLTVALTTAATGNGVTVDLTSSDSTKVSVSSATVTIPAGQTTPAVQPTLYAENVGSATISASATGYPAPTPLTVKVGATIQWLSSNPTNMGIGTTANLQLKLNAPVAPKTPGLVVSLSSSDPTKVTVQSAASFIWDGSTTPSILIPVNAVDVGSSVITASGVNIDPVTITVTVIGPPKISTVSLPTGVVGTSYSAPLAVAGGVAPYTWTPTGLPSPLTISPNTGAATQIAGTPAAAGTFTVNVTVNDSSSPTQSVSKQLTLTIVNPLTITLPSNCSIPLVVSTAFSCQPVVSGGTSPYTWSITGLPAGLLYDSSTGAVTGTPTTAGTYNVTFSVTDSTLPTHLSTAQQLTLTVSGPLTISTTSLPDGVQGVLYSGPLAAAGGVAPYTWTSQNLPSPLTINPNTGAVTAIAGTPAAAGTTQVTVIVTDSATPTHASVSKQLSLTIKAPLTLTLPANCLSAPVIGVLYSCQPAASGGTPSYTWLVTGLPAGFTSDSSGLITGTATAAVIGQYNVTVKVTDSTQVNQSQTFTWNITGVLAITTTVLPDAVATLPYSFTVTAAGGKTPYTWSASGLPADLSIDQSSGKISGTASATGAPTVTVTVTDASPNSVNKQFTLKVVSQLVISTASLPSGAVGTAYNVTVQGSGGTQAYNWTATGLPPGLSINASSGAISGTPTQGGTFSSVVVSLTDSGNPVQTATPKTFSITIQSLTITTTSLPQATVGKAYSYQLAATGGVQSYHWSSPALPRWMSLSDSGLISGTPNQQATNTITFSVTDSSATPQSDTKVLTLTVVAASQLVCTPVALPAGQPYVAYTSPAQTASGGTPPYSWTATGLPATLTMASSTGVITGTPTVAGTYTVNVTCADSGSQQVVYNPPLSLVIGTQSVITVSSATVGANLQVPIKITFSPAPTVDSQLTIASGNSSLVLLGSGADSGSPSLPAVTVPAGTDSLSTYVKALGSSGQVTITASMTGYTSGTGTVTLANSGFVLQDTNGIGAAISVGQGTNTTLTVLAARLDASSAFVETQQVRGGITVNVPVSSTVTSIGVVSTSSVTFSSPTDAPTFTFTASKTALGTTNVVAGPAPTPFLQPTQATLVVTVQTVQITPFSATIGKNLQTNVSLARTSASTSAAVLTVVSNDTRLKFSHKPTDAASDTITVTIAANQTVSPDFYAHGYDSSGTAAYTVSSPDLGSVNSTVTLAPSGIVIQSPFGFGKGFSMPANSSADATLYLWTAQLDSVGNVGAYQTAAADVSIPITVVSSDTTVGTIAGSPVTIAAGQDNGTASVTFHPVKKGTTQITASSPGFASGTVTATVTDGSPLVCTTGLTIGQFLQDSGQIIVPGGATAGLHVSIQSNSALLALSSSATAAGTSAISFDLSSGTIATPAFYLQSLASSGQATYTASAPGYGSCTASVTLAPSGVTIYGATSASAGSSQTFAVTTSQLDASNNIVGNQSLAGGANLVVSLTSSKPAVGTVQPTVTINAGDGAVYSQFQALTAGSTIVSVTQPGGWALPTDHTALGILVQ